LGRNRADIGGQNRDLSGGFWAISGVKNIGRISDSFYRIAISGGLGALKYRKTLPKSSFIFGAKFGAENQNLTYRKNNILLTFINGAVWIFRSFGGRYRADFAKSILRPKFGACRLFADLRVYIAKIDFRLNMAKSRGLTKLNFVTKKINKLTFKYGFWRLFWVFCPSTNLSDIGGCLLGIVPKYQPPTYLLGGGCLLDGLSMYQPKFGDRLLIGWIVQAWVQIELMGCLGYHGYRSHDWRYNQALGCLGYHGLAWISWLSNPTTNPIGII
jgi:hypothetical protein